MKCSFCLPAGIINTQIPTGIGTIVAPWCQCSIEYIPACKHRWNISFTMKSINEANIVNSIHNDADLFSATESYDADYSLNCISVLSFKPFRSEDPKITVPLILLQNARISHNYLPNLPICTSLYLIHYLLNGSQRPPYLSNFWYLPFQIYHIIRPLYEK